MPSELGQTSYQSLIDINAAVNQGTLTQNSSAFNTCISAISDYNCLDTAVFDGRLGNGDTSSIYKIFRVSSACQNLFN